MMRPSWAWAPRPRPSPPSRRARSTRSPTSTPPFPNCSPWAMWWLAETRTTEGTSKVLGGPMSAAVLYVRRAFASRTPSACRRSAFYKTLKWLEHASPEEIAAKVPPDYWLGDRELYTAAIKNNLQVYSRDGIISAESRQRSLDFLKQFDKEMAAATLDPSKTWHRRFVPKP